MDVLVQGTTDQAVIVNSIQTIVDSRVPASSETAYAQYGCGGGFAPRTFESNLNSFIPTMTPVDGDNGGTPIPAIPFPFKVSASDPEHFLIHVRTTRDDIRYHFEVSWTSGDRAGTIPVYDRDDQPFHIAGDANIKTLYDPTSPTGWASPVPVREGARR